MSLAVIPVIKGQACGCCGEPVEGQFAAYDDEMGCMVCTDCRCRCIIMVGYLAAAGIKKCIQLSGGKPLGNR